MKNREKEDRESRNGVWEGEVGSLVFLRKSQEKWRAFGERKQGEECGFRNALQTLSELLSSKYIHDTWVEDTRRKNARKLGGRLWMRNKMKKEATTEVRRLRVTEGTKP